MFESLPFYCVRLSGRLSTLACLLDAAAEAERITALDDLRDDRGLLPVLDPDGQQIGLVPAAIAVVSDNGPCFRGQA